MRIRRRFAFIAALVFLSVSGPLSAQELEKRIALVVGESAYAAGPLPTAANDAGLVAQTLQSAGFDVTGARDMDTQSLRDALHEFIEKARASGPDTVAMIYISGYGLQSDGENFVTGVDARIDSAADVSLNAVRASDFVQPLAALHLKARIVVLDAARKNPFVSTGQPLAGGLALMQPDDGALVAFNASPGTIGPQEQGPYSVYAKSLVEMIKDGGAPINEMFERVRMRVSEATQGGEIPWSASRISAPFVFFAQTAEIPADRRDQFTALASKPVASFDARDAYFACIARDTFQGYQEFLTAFPDDPLAKRVRVILAARREATIWQKSVWAGTRDAYWTYLERYPRGPHAWEARRRLEHLAVALAPPSGFVAMAYDVPPPPPDEIVYLDRPVVYLADPYWDFPPPPPPPVVYFGPPPVWFADYPPPPPPVAAFFLPIPIFYPVAAWVAPVPYLAPGPVNVYAANIHNTVVVNQVNNTVTVTNAAGQNVPALPNGAGLGVGNAIGNAVGAHPGLAAAAAAALPAAALAHAATRSNPGALAPNHALPTSLPNPGATGPAGSRPLPPAPGVTPGGRPNGTQARTPPAPGATPNARPNATQARTPPASAPGQAGKPAPALAPAARVPAAPAKAQEAAPHPTKPPPARAVRENAPAQAAKPHEAPRAEAAAPKAPPHPAAAPHEAAPHAPPPHAPPHAAAAPKAPPAPRPQAARAAPRPAPAAAPHGKPHP